MAAGSLGPRLAGRLTAELILRSPQYMNCVKDYEIDLRGSKINSIENLGATQNQFDSIDLSDNNIIILEGFPKLPRLKTLLLNNNRITRIGRHLQESIPNLTHLILTNNRLKHLADLEPLSTLPKLQHLSLLDNEVTKAKHYRLYLIHQCKHLKVLDFRKVKQKERQEAENLFAAEPDLVTANRTFEPGAHAPAADGYQGKRAKAQSRSCHLLAAIANAATLEEVARLEEALRTGHMPSQLLENGVNGDAAAMEEG
ncbi:L domain-like protein [Coccomyxa subellipsoidea C-169]|uniref:L domain-like protein n=1 Tax=Coccomyxa subellipsoidea (strain C-169) TaxID=574566 RepID=I0YUC8_COCSC|nr:L domain-like protein [Coccomyxa subellipsoidea C-169]EIE21997.1 L domain-like protein [Coccomyxa subellipsoidea C-169]|eukprot:XP_005646541.1 L domain-like protein [Coccomyxa subellipsoidea C-169]